MDPLEQAIEELKKELGEDVITTGSTTPRPEKAIIREAFDDFNERNPLAGGGMLVQPSADGSRPGYAMTEREKNIARTAREKIPGAYITPLRRKFDGQKFISVKDPTYSDGRKRVKTPEYEAFLEKERAKKKPPTFGKTAIREVEDGVLLQIAEAMQKADIEDDAEYLMRNKAATKLLEEQQAGARKKAGKKVYKQRVYKKGMLDQNAVKYLEDLETNPVRLKIIADSLGEDIDWVLNKLDERDQFVLDVKSERDVAKQQAGYKKPRNDYLKVENWLQKNAKKYASPDTFERALIRRFGKDNQFVKDMRAKKPFATVYFSDEFKKTMLNADVKSSVKPIHLKQLIKSSLYNFNPKIKNAVTTEIKNIFNSENLPKLRTEARKLLNNNKILSTFGLNKAITGPYAKVIQAEIGQQLWSDITNFRAPRVGTQEMLKAFEQIVADEFKPMFNEAAKAIGFSKNNQWENAKKVFGIADNIAWDHKIPSSLIDKGYADIIEYTKVNPTTANFNERIKNAQFDRPLNKLITQFEKATTLDAKAKIKNKMDILKNDFSQKYSGYLDEVSIDLDQKGNLKFSSSAKPLSMRDDRIQMLGKSLVQEGSMTEKKMLQSIQSYSKLPQCKVGNADGGRIGFAFSDQCIRDGLNEMKKSAAGGDKKAARQLINTAKNAATGGRLLKNVLGPGAIFGEAIFEGAIIGNKILGGKPLKQAWAESYLSYLDPRKYRGELDPLLFERDRMLEQSGYKDVLKAGFSAQDQLSAANEAVEKRNIASARNRLDQYLPAAADAREQAARAGLSTKIISDEAFKDAVNLAQESIQGLEGNQRFKYGIASTPQGEGADAMRRQKAETAMKNLYTQFTDQELRDMLGPEKFDILSNQRITKRIIPSIATTTSGLDYLRSLTQEKEAMERFADNFRYEKAGGGIAGLSGGIDKGPQRISMNPDSQGLSGLLKNDNKI